MKFTFKHTGEKLSDITVANASTPRPILGIKTPLRPGRGSSGLFDMHTDSGAQIRDNLKNLLLTNHGERPGVYDFGANLRHFAFELQSPNFDSLVITSVKNTVEKFMPYIKLRQLELTDNTIENLPENASVKLRIIYDVSDLGIISDGIDVFIRAGA